jgi:uncharacterized protein (DUF1778 family)
MSNVSEYEEITIRVSKVHKALIQAVAESEGETLEVFMAKALREHMRQLANITIG